MRCSLPFHHIPTLAGHAAAAVACSAAAGLRQYSQLALHNVRPGVVGGPGNRSSVTGGVATVFGATGFVGKYIVNELAKRGTQVVCPYRSLEEKAITLKQMGDLGQVGCSCMYRQAGRQAA
jgi:NADH dehydrogenase (ubiquinone) 1 alpha subcomplex subunit 9